MQRDEVNYNFQETIRIGTEAANLLRSPVFNNAYRAVMDDITVKLFNCEPGHTKTMEELRREGNALVAVTKKLQLAAAQAEQEYMRQAEQQARPEPY